LSVSLSIALFIFVARSYIALATQLNLFILSRIVEESKHEKYVQEK